MSAKHSRKILISKSEMAIRTAGCIENPNTVNSCDRDEDAPTVLSHAHFRSVGVCGSSSEL